MSEAPQRHPMTLGIDLGTSAIKVVAVGRDGAVIGEAATNFPTSCSLPRQAEQAPSDWLQAVSSAMCTLGDNLHGTGGGLGQVAAIGLTGQLPTLVCLSADAPVAPAITWKDGRADAWAAVREIG